MASIYEDNNTIEYKVSLYSPYEELTASLQPIYPGFLCQQSALEEVLPHLTADGTAERLIAVENSSYRGKTIYDRYEVGERVMLRIGRSGDVFLCAVQSDLAISIDDFVTSAGDGTLKPVGVTPLTGCVIGRAMETHLVGPAGSIDLMAVRIK
jgi:hypothetical protein